MRSITLGCSRKQIYDSHMTIMDWKILYFPLPTEVFDFKNCTALKKPFLFWVALGKWTTYGDASLNYSKNLNLTPPSE